MRKADSEFSRPEQDLKTLLRIEAQVKKERSLGERLAGWAIGSAGSMPFVAIHVVWFAAWTAVNAGLIKGITPFDPFPFAFLTLVVSLEAIFLALLVLIAQNRITKEADRRSLLDLEINLLAEQESTKTLAILQRIGAHLGLDSAVDKEAQRLATRTNVTRLAEILEKKNS